MRLPWIKSIEIKLHLFIRKEYPLAEYLNVIWIIVAFVCRVLRLDEFTSELIGQVPVETQSPTGGNISLTIPCGFFSRGGTYSIRLQSMSVPPPPKFTNIANLHQVQVYKQPLSK